MFRYYAKDLIRKTYFANNFYFTFYANRYIQLKQKTPK